MVTYFIMWLFQTFLCKKISFEKPKISMEACFLHKIIFINSLVSFHKNKKITEHLFK